jgi:hypothetical protein
MEALMRVCFFFSSIWPEAYELLRAHAPGAEEVWTGGDDYQYWRETAARWGQDDLVTVEGDIGIHEKVIPEFTACPEPWCCYSYQVGSYMCTTGGGCRKLSLPAQQAVTLADIAYPVRDIGECPECAALCWRHLDTRITSALMRAGFRVHVHEPPVRHLRMETRSVPR